MLVPLLSDDERLEQDHNSKMIKEPMDFYFDKSDITLYRNPLLVLEYRALKYYRYIIKNSL